jgi:cortactin
MWKATATLGKPIVEPNRATDDSDDWDSDPNFTNEVSEKDQRWGRQKTIEDESSNTRENDITMEELRKKVINNHNEKVGAS